MSAHGGSRRFEPPVRLRDVVEHATVVWHTGGTCEVLLPDVRGSVLVVSGTAPVVTNPLTGQRGAEGSLVRGPALDVQTCETTGPGVCLVVGLTPVGLARLCPRRPVPRGPVPADELFGPGGVDEIVNALNREDNDSALAATWEAVDRLPRQDVGDGDLLAQALEVAQCAGGVVRAVDLAHEVGVPISHLYRWCVDLLGVDPGGWLSAVRFATFVRGTVGPGPVSPDRMVATLRWYVQAQYSPRETERFTGLPSAELRRLAERLETACGKTGL
ncbi:MAG: hypothetical protein FWF02_07470 [Micrococcales bacterium]|nr:hypothetical protein [Micrococcales bacterium]MCL2667531.1 hypothetical protein [Micrococcales bacterium]